MPSPAPTAKSLLPDGIEIFRPGTHIDDSGTAHSFSEADLAATAKAYDPTIREAPLCVGHPESDKPAYGFVRALQVNTDGRLAMSTADVQAAFAEMVRERRFPKRSASFYPPRHPNNPKPGVWYLRHVAFLGAQPPAVAGLRDIQFADDAAGLVNFSEAQPTEQEPPMPTATKKTAEELQAELDQVNAQIAAANGKASAAEAEAADAKAKLAQFAEQKRAERTAGFVSFAEDQVKAAKLRPADKAALVATLEALADAQPVDFAEGGQVKKLPLADWLKERVAGGAPMVQFGEHAPGGDGGGGTKGMSDAELDKRAQDYARQHKVSYADAITAVCSFTG